MFEFMTCTPPPIHQPPPSFVKRRMPAPYLHTPFPHCYQEYPVIWFTILVQLFQPYPPSPPTREEYLALLPSKGENHSTLSPLLAMCSCCHDEDKRHTNTLSYSKEREKPTLPLLWRHPVAPPRMSTLQQCGNMFHFIWTMRRVVAAAFLQSLTDPHNNKSYSTIDRES